MLSALPEFDPEAPRKELWSLKEDVTFLNHGSFGPSPVPIQLAQQQIAREIESQPSEFYFRAREELLEKATARVAQYWGTKSDNMLLVNNATVAMNIVANSFMLEPDDEVLLTNHEYGAVQNIWRSACKEQGAVFGMAELPHPITNAEDVIEAIFKRVTNRTKLIVVSHVTSPTAIVLPVKEICQRARQLNIPVCVDGPHALLMQPLHLNDLGCQFYTASCHKWFSAPFGTGFLYVKGQHKSNLKPLITSWGRSLAGKPKHWKDSFLWQGTDNYSSILTLPAVLDFWSKVGEEKFREHSFQLSQYAHSKISELFPQAPLAPINSNWIGSMISIPIGEAPPANKHIGKVDPLQKRLWEEFKIEVPIPHWNGLKLIRISSHLYNDQSDIDRLTASLLYCLRQNN